ncbi:hypothetical protein Tco_1200105 [Tanacetum coccineum]
MEAHLARTQPTQVNKITTSCEICSVPYDTWYYMEDPEQAFVEYASSRTDEAGSSKPTVQSQTVPSTTILKAINQVWKDWYLTSWHLKTPGCLGTLPSDTVKNPKLSTSPVLSASSYPTIDSQCSSHPSNSINAIKAHFK